MDTPLGDDEEPGLEIECATFRAVLPSLRMFGGWFALIQGRNLIGLFQTMVGATDVGYRCFGVTLFLVRKIEPAAAGLTMVT